MDISVVIPVRDEEGNIPALHQRLKSSLKKLKVSYEVIFVTDINRDNTFAALQELNKKDKDFKVIKLSNSYGQHVAVIAGLEKCSGKSIVIMDGDLQDYPEDIEKLYNKQREGYDIVYGVKEKKNDSFMRNVSSKTFVYIINLLSDVKTDYNTSMFRIISKRTRDEILRFEERQPSLVFIMSLIGFPSASVMVTSGERETGESKYSFMSLVNLAMSMLLSFSTKPIRLISYLGFIFSLLSFLYFVFTLVSRYLLNITVPGWTTIIALITLLGGLQLFSIGVIGEYIARVFIESKRRPLYIIDKEVGKFKDRK